MSLAMEAWFPSVVKLLTTFPSSCPCFPIFITNRMRTINLLLLSMHATPFMDSHIQLNAACTWMTDLLSSRAPFY
jgi:hypothetical protein